MNQGQVLNGGKAMSKSLGNGVNLGEQLDKFGVDAVRTTMIFASPPEDDVDWADVSPAGSQKFLARAWRVAQDVTSEPGVDAASGDANLHKLVARTVHDVKQLLDSGKFNVVVAKTMELVNATRKAIDSGPGERTLRYAKPPKLLRSCCHSTRRTLPRTCGTRWDTITRC